MGEIPDSIILVESKEQVAALELPADAKLAYVTQTTLSVDETGDVITALRERFPGDPRSAARGHLLRDLEPAVGREGAARADRPAARDRLAQLVQLEPARRDGAGRRGRRPT